MKITIEKEFTSAGEAAAWLQKLVGTGSTVTVIPPAFKKAEVSSEAQVSDYAKPRKPRNDAGKPRGSYLEKAAAAKINGEASTSEPARMEDSASQVAAAVTPTPPNAVPTKEDVLAALKRMALKKGFGTLACVAHLAEFKVKRLSDLDAKHYPLFIKQIDAKLAAGAE